MVLLRKGRLRMDRLLVQKTLEAVSNGVLSVEQAMEALRDLPYTDLGFARVDHHRTLRRGQPEVIYCPGKTPGQVAAIAAKLAELNRVVLATRADDNTYEEVLAACPEARYDPVSRLITIGQAAACLELGTVALVSAGTSDLAVAEECACTLAAYGICVVRIYDVGVAGLHRLLDSLAQIRSADAVVVVAGMDGALPSVVGGLIDRPVVAVPTSVGYGASFGGLSALLAMLNSCAAGVAVVNIDNGFGAARFVYSLLRSAFDRHSRPAPQEPIADADGLGSGC